jgi:hypothetical protein
MTGHAAWSEPEWVLTLDLDNDDDREILDGEFRQ